MASRTSTVKTKTNKRESEEYCVSTVRNSPIGECAEFVHSNPVPLEEDSDSDFNPGSFVYEPTRKSKSATKSKSTSGPGSRKKRRETVDVSEDYQPRKDLGLKPVSDDEDGVAEVQEQPSDEVSNDETEEEPEPPVVLNTFAVLQKRLASNSNRINAANEAVPSCHPVDDSETESESEPESVTKASPNLKRKDSPAGATLPVMKKARVDSDDDSVTEEETEEEDPNAAPATAPPKVSADSGSETESDAEAEEESDLILRPRPAFILAPGKKSERPFVLDPGYSVPWKINTFLRGYQREGIRFFYERYKEGRGGVLGDDMGLKHGDKRDIDRRRKHVSHLQDISPEWKKRRVLPPANATWPTCLIIAPSSVVGNWQREFETWSYFEVGMYTGTKNERGEVLHDFKMGRLDVLVTSFETARNDIALLDDLPWSCIIVDEVHRLKNPRSGTALAYDQFTCTVRFGLTGTGKSSTPIQNSYSEFWTILNWTNPGKVGTKRQWDNYVTKPLGVGQSKSASVEQRSRGIRVAQVLAEKLLPHFFLRRTKDIIREQLPNKLDEVAFCPLTPKQIEVYKRILNTEAVQNMIRKDELSPTDTPEQTVRNRELAKMAFPEGSIPKYGPAIMVPNLCGKWLVLESLLKDWRRDPTNKVLIFTKSVKILKILDYHLQAEGLGFVTLEGSTRPQDRMPLIDKFHEDPDIFVFLISTLAGGTGLNLTGANKVVIFDPAHDLQAIDRAYRFGQTRDVEVFRLLGAGSIEELIYARQVYKQQQMQVGYNASFQTRYFEGVQGDKDKQGELFGIKNIFTLHEDTLATKTAIEKAVVSDFNWALANVEAKKRKPSADSDVETDKPQLKDDDLRGLDSLLLDDRPVQVDRKDDRIQRILNAVGVVYIHRNEDLIAESAIEGQRHKNAVEEKKKARKANAKAKGGAGAKTDSTPGEVWPPVRSHHRRKMTPEERMRARQASMIEMGHITSAEQLTSFLMQFNKWSVGRQNDFLVELDRHHARAGRKL
ncbi:P-loop containing nucleoside triphosphate hydrolase protein [Rhodofomes roseus]|uniref:P-loop containing nucleoside triphosphate hydrolase protein n=1 Tax=Rhodofomes roseus TaxID=34475 RepID=A0ABQ8KB19_9APHY|nr:P-loop containing nucleoside triphosphate hydrolase protein [Rhodofomes roseus]KAH9834464.1 P-loop containing nucleoside triphosphate hydrolase protein [Rhodofomes roseus]